ncbi:unnamed protein product [Vitrella brassicaformis CCMP3155]|uniref:RING-type domain-containing protein n=2 Tax=Vitrella brassicaformis TaxID=1169539 RepID=A0A0G4G567_VITBC|nr:unnamed protein product [Vitrella brassicaformis CCMP3155]|eukprot:CEM23625.1 unnamed protein product [Vitrella brassicaformis CCMP3155]
MKSWRPKGQSAAVWRPRQEQRQPGTSRQAGSAEGEIPPYVPSSTSSSQPAPSEHRGGRHGRGQGGRRDNHRPNRVVTPPAAGETEDQDLPAGGSQLTERLTRLLKKGNYDCMICMGRVGRHTAIWSCPSCFAMFHLRCIHSWIRKSNTDHGTETLDWRCPACQYIHLADKLPQYECFCGRCKNPPPVDFSQCPHSCGEPCSRRRTPASQSGAPPSTGGNNVGACPHPCPLICHPGPCPPCTAMGLVIRCHCGRTGVQKLCGDVEPFSCREQCRKTLNCGIHQCQKECHPGACGPCGEMDEQTCHCGKPLDCGKHTCRRTCHGGMCFPCPWSPSRVVTCPCGKRRLTSDERAARVDCTAPIPTCGEVCGRLRECGHGCTALCHEGPCPPCSFEVKQDCRCGRKSRRTTCSEAEKGPYICNLECKRRKSCGRHRCTVVCCPAYNTPSDVLVEEHLCLLVCGKPLSCGVEGHRCTNFCHLGNCPPCPITLREPLTCACGRTALEPPLPCGTKPPDCTLPCTKILDCGHQCQSTCHFGDCPPCAVLTEKMCAGGHVVKPNVPCFVRSEKVSCGRLCQKTLACGKHQCTRTCHAPPCPPCNHKCGKLRLHCEHLCEATCHGSSPCPDVPCPVKVQLQCRCGHLKREVPCGGCSADPRRGELPKLPCEDACGEADRARRLASAFRKDEPVQEEFYVDDLVEEGRFFRRYLEGIEAKLDMVVKTRHSGMHLAPCDGRRRQFIQSYAELHYGLAVHTAKDGDDNHAHPVVMFDGRLSRVPNPLLSVVVDRTPPLGAIARPLTGFKKKNVIRFGQLVPRIVFFHVDRRTTVKTLSDLLEPFRGDLRVRAEGDTMYAEFLVPSAAQAAMRHLKTKSHPFTSLRVEIPSLPAQAPSASPQAAEPPPPDGESAARDGATQGAVRSAQAEDKKGERQTSRDREAPRDESPAVESWEDL